LHAKYLCHTRHGFLTCRKIKRHGADGFNSPPKEGLLLIFIALKNPSSSPGFEPSNLGYIGKHENHQTTENDEVRLTIIQYLILRMVFLRFRFTYLVHTWLAPLR
jgi:hypothetical protein